MNAGEEQIDFASPEDTEENGWNVLQDKLRLLCGKLKSIISMLRMP